MLLTPSKKGHDSCTNEQSQASTNWAFGTGRRKPAGTAKGERNNLRWTKQTRKTTNSKRIFSEILRLVDIVLGAFDRVLKP
jgi:hypothetical protein